MRHALRSSISVFALLPVLAMAQESDSVMLEAVTVTASRAARTLDEIPQSVQVISREQIEAQLQLSPNPSAVISKLIPGFSVSNQTISGASESFRGRDLLIMIDGVPLNTPLRDVSRMMAMIDLNAIDRIEVVAGASSLYGSGATGGTVNFITKQAAPGAYNLTAGVALRAFTADPGGSLAPETTVSASGRLDAFDYSVTATGKFADRTFDGAGRELPSDGMLGQGGGDRYGQGSFSGKVGHDFNSAQRVEVAANWIYMQQNPDWLTNYSQPFARPDTNSPYNGRSVKEDSKSASLRFEDKSFTLGNLSVLGFFNDIEKRFNYSEVSVVNNFVLYSGNSNSPTSRDNQTTLFSKRFGLNATIDSQLDNIYPGLKLTWGADVGHEDTRQYYGDDIDAFTPLKQLTYAGFAQLQAPIGDRLTVRGGVRYEHFDLSVDGFTRPATYAIGLLATPVIFQPVAVTGGDFSYSAPTFNAGATFKLTASSELYGGFSQGYSLADIGAFTRRAGLTAALMRGGSVSYGAIAPDAQLVNNYELGIRGSLSPTLRGSLGGFVSTSDKGVTFDAATNALSQQKEIIYGVEATAEYDVTSALSLGAVLSWREGRYDRDKDGKIDSDLPNNRISTPWRGLLYGTYRFAGGTVLRVEEEMWSGRSILEGTARRETEGALLTHLSLAHPFGGGQAYLAVNNLFDTDYEVPTATATRNLPVNGWGRTVLIGYRVQF